MDIPVNVRIALLIEQGSVFNFRLEVQGEGRQSKNRFFVVVNRNPKTDSVLLMLTSTSQIAKKKEFVKRAQIDEKTIVIVTPAEYSVFSMESAFNCNDVFEVKMTDLIRKINAEGSMDYPKISKDIINRIIIGINLSPRISPALKKLL